MHTLNSCLLHTGMLAGTAAWLQVMGLPGCSMMSSAAMLTGSALCSMPLEASSKFGKSGLCIPASFYTAGDTNISSFARVFATQMPSCPPDPVTAAASSSTPLAALPQAEGGAHAGAITGTHNRMSLEITVNPAMLASESSAST